MATGTLGGVVTTVEGLLASLCDKLRDAHGFDLGDSAPRDRHSKWADFFERSEALLRLEV